MRKANGVKNSLLIALTRIFVSATRQRYAPMDMFLIYFGSATFDQIEKDTKMTMETMVGVIGGTMGLFTGFSILSGVEIVYYAVKFILSAITKKVRS